MNIRLVTPAAQTEHPVSMATAVRHMSALQEDADRIDFLLRVATAAVEDYTGRSLVTKEYELALPRWPRRTGVELRRTPVQEITAVEYLDEDNGEYVTVDPLDYLLDISSQPNKLLLTEDYDLPSLGRSASAVRIRFTAGYGTNEEDIEPRLRQAVLMFARHLFDNPNPVGPSAMVQLPLSYQHLVRSLRIESLTCL